MKGKNLLDRIAEFDNDSLMPPAVSIKEIDGRWFRELYFGPDWIDGGLFPKPRTRFQWAKYHLMHGLLMGFPVMSVFSFILRDFIQYKERRCNEG